jgi:predicted Zn-dependent protease with MMP-like domain
VSETLEGRLESAWTALDRGDVKAAKAVAEAAKVAEPDAPEVHTLLGAIASSEGDYEGAMNGFRRAIELDPEYFDPVFLGAQAAAADGALEEALELAERALDLSDEEEEYLDTLLLKAELELALDDPDAAAETLAELPPPSVSLPEAIFHVRAGACLLDLDELDAAEKHYQAAVTMDPANADAEHGLGLCAEARGDEAARTQHFQKVRTLDLAEPLPEHRLTQAQIEERIEAALKELPEPARTLLGNVPILLEAYPSEALVNDGVDPRVLGLFTGTPYPEQSSLGAPPHLEHILLFERNLLRDATTVEELEQEIRTTLLHETGHFFGMVEEDLEEVGLE